MSAPHTPAAWAPPAGLPCPDCDYPVGGVAGGRRPECGRTIGPEDVRTHLRREVYLELTSTRAVAGPAAVGGLVLLFLLAGARGGLSLGAAGLASVALGLAAGALPRAGRGMTWRTARRTWWVLWPWSQAGVLALLLAFQVAPAFTLYGSPWNSREGRMICGTVLVAATALATLIYRRRARRLSSFLGISWTAGLSRWMVASRLAFGVSWALSALGFAVVLAGLAMDLADRWFPGWDR